MNLKKFLSGVIVGTFIFGVSAADISTASAAYLNDNRTAEEIQKDRQRRENQRISARKQRIVERAERKNAYEEKRKKEEEERQKRREEKRERERLEKERRNHRPVKYDVSTGFTVELLANATSNVSAPPQMKNGQNPPEPPKDKDGNIQAPPDGKNPPQMKDGQKPPEPPKDKNGNIQAPPDDKNAGKNKK